MTSFVLRHLMDGIVNGVIAQFFRPAGQGHLAFGGAAFGFHTHAQVGFGRIGHNFTQQFGKLGGMFGFLIGSLLPIQADFIFQ